MVTVWRADPTLARQHAPLHQLLEFAARHGLRVTSGEYITSAGIAWHPEGGHNAGSLHYQGRAIDVSTHSLTTGAVQQIVNAARAEGINCYDERERPPCGVWTGPHLHLSISPPGTHLI